MAMLAVLDVDDLATPKIERVKNALDDLGKKADSTARSTSGSTKALLDVDGVQEQVKAITALNQQFNLVRTQSNAWGLLNKQMQEGTTVSKTQAAALKALGDAIIYDTKYSNDMTASAIRLNQGLKAGSTVTAEQAKQLAALGGEFNKVNGIVTQTPQKLNEAEKGFSKFAQTANLLGQALVALGAGYQLKGLLTESFQLAARNQVLSTTMKVVADNAHQSSGAFELQAQKVKALGITTKEARESVIQFAQAQLDTKRTADIARVAQDLAVVAGINSSEAFNRLTRAIQMQQGIMLRSFGIVKGTTQIYQEYAQTIGKTVQTLTDFEKREAFIHAIMKEGEKVSGAYVNAMNDVGKAMTSLARYQEEAKAKLGEGLLPIMLKAVLVYTEWLKWLGSLSPETMKWVTALLTAVAAMTAFLGVAAAWLAMAPMFLAAWTAVLGPIGLFALAIGAVTAAFVVMTATAAPQVEASLQRATATQAEIETLDRLQKKLGEQKKVLEEASKAQDGSTIKARELSDATIAYQMSLSKLSALYPGVVSGEKDTAKAYDETTAAINRKREALQSQRVQEIQFAIQEGRRAKVEFDEATARANELRDLYQKVSLGDVEAIRVAWDRVGRMAGVVSPALRNMMDAISVLGLTSVQKAALLHILEDAVKKAEERAIAAGAAFTKFRDILDQIDPAAAADRITNSVNRIMEAFGGREGLARRGQQLKVDVSAVVNFDRETFEKDLNALRDQAKNIADKIATAEPGSKRLEQLHRDYVATVTRTLAFVAESDAKLVAAETNITKADTDDKNKRAENLQKYQQAYKTAYESLMETNATAGASFAAARDALGEAGLSTEQYASRLLRAKSIIEQFNKASPEMQRQFAELKTHADQLKAIELDQTLEKWQKKFTEVTEAVEKTVSEMGNNYWRAAQERIEAADRAHVEAKRKYAREIENLEVELFERTALGKMSEVEQKIYADEKYWKNFRRGIEDQIHAIRQQQEEEVRAIQKRREDQTRQLDETIANAKLRFKIELDSATALAKAKLTIEKARSAEQIEIEIRGIKQSFDERMDIYRTQGVWEINLFAQREEEALRIRRDAQDEHIAILQETADKSVELSAESTRKIIEDNKILEQAQQRLWTGVVQTAADAVAGILTGQMSLKEGLISIWNSIKSSLFSVFDEIVKRWIRNAAIMATSQGGFNVGTFLKGLIGQGGTQVATQAGTSYVSSAVAGTAASIYGAGAAGGAAGVGGAAAGSGYVGQAVAGTASQVGAAGQAGMLGAGWGSVGGAGAGAAVGYFAGKYSGSKTVGALSGAGSGAIVGAILGGPIGAGIGALVGAVAGLIGGGAQGRQVRKERDQFLSSVGGADQFRTNAAAAGMSQAQIDKFFDVNKVKEWQKVVFEAQKALTLWDFAKPYAGLENLKKQAAELGVDLSQALNAKDAETLQKVLVVINEQMQVGARRAEFFASGMGDLAEQAGINLDAVVGGFGESAEDVNRALDLVEAKLAFIDQAGGLSNVRKITQLLGIDIQKAFDAKTLAEFEVEIAKINRALEQQQKRLAGLGQAAEGLALRVEGLAGYIERATKDLLGGLDPEKAREFTDALAEAQRGGYEGGPFKYMLENAEKYGLSLDEIRKRQDRVQTSINRVGQYAMATFGGILRETGDIMQAFNAVAGPLDQLAEILAETGTEAQGAFRYLMEFRNTIRNNEDVANSLSGINQMLTGLSESGRLTAEMFNTFGADAADQWKILEERGVAADQALLLMQPTLQALYEAQKRYGFATDEATQNLINMGLEQGIIGDQFQDVNSKMLDMLVIIAEVLGADIPEAYRRQETAAEDAGTAGTEAAQETQHELEILRQHEEAAKDEWLKLQKVIDDTDLEGVEDLSSAVQDLPSDFDAAAKAAIDAGIDIANAMRDAKWEVDGLSEGHSPGGLKDIRIRAREAAEAIRLLRESSRPHFRGMKEDIDGMTGTYGPDARSTTRETRRGSRAETIEVQVNVEGEVVTPVNLDSRTITKGVVKIQPNVLYRRGVKVAGV